MSGRLFLCCGGAVVAGAACGNAGAPIRMSWTDCGYLVISIRVAGILGWCRYSGQGDPLSLTRGTDGNEGVETEPKAKVAMEAVRGDLTLTLMALIDPFRSCWQDPGKGIWAAGVYGRIARILYHNELSPFLSCWQ